VSRPAQTTRLELAVAPPVHRAGKHVVAEERDLAAGDHEHEREPAPGSAPPRVEQRRQLGLPCGEELKLVEHDNRPLARRGEARDRRQRGRPAGERLLRKQLVPADERQLLREVAQLHRLRRVRRLEVERAPSLREARQQLGLADAAAAPQHEEASLAGAPEVVEGSQLVGSVEELHHCDSSI
jgi:hypothetical protein